MKKIAAILTIIVFAAGLVAQTSLQKELLAFEEPVQDGDGAPSDISGVIRGRIIDASTGEALIGANLFLTGTTTGTITDFDGNFSLTSVNPGKVSVTASYVSYETQVFQSVEVPAGKVVVLNANLDLSSQSIQEVVVTARKREQTEEEDY